MSIRIQEIVVEDLLSRDNLFDHWFDLGTQKYRLLKRFNEAGYPVIIVVSSNSPIPQNDHEKLEKTLGVKLERYLEEWFSEPKELLRWTPDEDQIGFVMEYIFEFGWGLESAFPRPALKDVSACCPRCAEVGAHNECKYCADPPAWALKLRDLGLAHMSLGDGFSSPSGWHWSIN